MSLLRPRAIVLRHSRAVLALHMAARHRVSTCWLCVTAALPTTHVLKQPAWCLCGPCVAAGESTCLRGWVSWQQRCLYNNTYYVIMQQRAVVCVRVPVWNCVHTMHAAE